MPGEGWVSRRINAFHCIINYVLIKILPLGVFTLRAGHQSASEECVDRTQGKGRTAGGSWQRRWKNCKLEKDVCVCVSVVEVEVDK